MRKRNQIGRKLEKEPMSKKQLRTKYNLKGKGVRDILDSFGSELIYDHGLYHINRSTLPNYGIKKITLEKDEKIGLLGDTHLCSKYACMDSLHEYYDDLDEAGVKRAFHSGDLTDGYLVYKGQLEDLIIWGEPNQRNYVLKNYPKKKNIKTYVVAGNHDLHGFQRGGSNIVENICRERNDLEYAGMYSRRFLANNNIKIDIVHDTSGRAYSLSYPAQRRQRDTPPSQRPNLSAAGHRHVVFYTYYNDEHMFETGCFVKSNPYMLGRGIQSTIAGWIAELGIEDNYLKKIKPELVTY